MSAEKQADRRGLLRQGLAALRSEQPRARPSRRAIAIDIGLAVVVLAVSLGVALISYNAGHVRQLIVDPVTGQAFLGPPTRATIAGVAWQALASAVVTSVPLALRRVYPLTAFLVLLTGMLLTRAYATDVTFLAAVFAAYSAVAYSRFRGAALVSVPVAGLIASATFWTVTPAGRGGEAVGLRAGRLTLSWATPWRSVALLALVSMVLIAVIGNAVHAREARARLLAQHEAATRRAVEQERARIASELHDVVTHNVSVMIVQAGAARQVLAETPGEARAALLAVESSGRAAMAELRHLLGLLSPAPAAGEAAGAGEIAAADLRPQPGLGQLSALVDRVGAAGLPVELRLGEVPAALPPGLDLAAFRVVQEGLTNVLRHAGKPRTSVRVDCDDGSLVVEVADAGPPLPYAGPVTSGGGRGLLGLRERAELYGGQLDAGPVPGGGWLVRARLPVDPVAARLPANAEPALAGTADGEARAGDTA